VRPNAPSFPQPIDFLVFDHRAWQLVDDASIEEVTYDPQDRDAARGTPSDHCPIAVSLELAAPDDGEGEEEPDTDTTDLDLLYAPAEGLEGEELRSVLHEIAKQGHSRLSYADVWGALDFTDEDPDNPDNVILLYTGRSHPKADKVSTVLNPDHNNDSWNREHVWPKSHGFPSQGSSRTPTSITFARRTSPATPISATSTSTRASSRTPIALPGAMRTASSRAMRLRAMSPGCYFTWTSATPATTACQTSL
jgi:hypothetical protein